ncbi:monovalent cation/H+ antiporter subunit A [Pseudomonas sp. LY-1]|jgi:multicomponent K+:H+ antiporter subunit A|uniref:Monovalent cation/H+ antiporter subunit A n=4 Tax=Pseudomonas TaxID=286 RepID=A0A0R3B394_PSEVE|nr:MULTISPECIES: monovalent cation/H+ antiporter subunit A [Pseudomonas]SEC91964.1 multisubunit potassium/proton antiporter, PhaA subunit /multisubunit potassium/proton antiporter, PhaB subunit [Pseudomonas marginalis]KRP79798.1 monovalent cation/H+ antiporter subunit A [Pseudomonas veronii]MBI6552786.1 monovalent cation/H+ antiporter subunit A [Pseudomonas veronii]MBI6647968.1 monovalent cation/H+ antiporter subunit A [Pseudomonas veronii]MBJ2179754.1 monovalent cation/H+ antiporter subunit A
MSLIVLLLLPFIGSCLAALLPHNARNTESLLAGLIALIGTVQVALLYPQIAHGGVIREEFMWLPSLGVNFVLRMDGFAWLFSMLVLGIGTLVSLYARYYMSPDDPVPRFFAFFLAFMGAMLGLVISGNLIQIVFFWELTSLFSFLLIGYWHHRADARRGAYMALMVTGAGGLCLLAGVMLLGHIVGSYDLDLVLAAGDQIRAHSLYPVMLALVLIGALSKSAQFPFHFWLPHAMAAPTPVSAYLHSATMVKAGVFLLARLWPSLSGSEEWFWLVGGAGALTLLLGAYCAMFQNDLKGLLAYSTISHLGLITLLLGLNSPLAAVAAVFHILNHATFKASLFMAAGIIDHESGTRDIRKLSGLVRLIPFTATLAMVASASMAGVPLLNGFLSKEMFFAETVFISSTAWVEIALPVIATIAGTFSVAYALRFTVDVFFGPPATDLPHTPHEPPRWMRAPVELLVFTCLLVGIFPAQVVGSILAAAALPVVGGVLPQYSLAIWHGWNAPMIMSLVAMCGGVLLYLLLRKQLKRGRFKYPPVISYFNGKRGFERCLVLMMRGARKIEKRISTKRLQTQLFLLVLVAVIGGLIPLLNSGLSWGDRPKIPGSIVFVTLWLLAIACALGAAWQAKYHRLAALTMVSVCGMMTCITFVWFSAPDLALTQLVVEVVTTVLILLGLRWLPRRIEEVSPLPSTLRKARIRRLRDFLLSTVVGGGMALLSYAMLTRQTPNDISSFYLSRALPEGGGSNVVNVMLVDFRGFDTLGEITVLGAVALTVYALLRRFRPSKESMQLPAQQRQLAPDVATDLINPRQASDTALGYMMVPAVLVRLLLPIALVVSFYLFMRGHNQPGGGFVAGLVMSVAFILQYMVAGTQWVEAQMSLRPMRWMGFGLFSATLTGLGALFAGYPFLTTHTWHLSLPVLGDIHIASALFFDVGVYAMVVGSTLLMLTALGHQSVRAHKPSNQPKTVATPEGAA